MLEQTISSFRAWFFSRNLLRRLRGTAVLEIVIIIIWAVWVGRAYLNMSPTAVPNGREFGMAIHPHYIWTQFKECGACVFWNGFTNGGSPAFAELHGVVLHPLVIIATLIWGGLNGAKITLIGSLAMAGIGQWGLARVMKLNWVARLWSAAVVITAGHLASRMEIGVIGVVVSTAASALVIAPGLKLALDGKRRDVIWLGVTLALAIVSGQGYLQLGLALALLPAFFIFFINDQGQIRPVWKEFALAGILALMLAGVFLVPLIHFWPQFGKPIDAAFSSAQPIQYIPLNFVINDLDFYYTTELSKLPYPYIYMTYIGWIPVLLALLPFRLARRSELRQLAFFWIAIALVLLASSALTFKLMLEIAPEFAAGAQTPGLIAGLAVPLILGLAAWGVDRVLKLDSPTLILALSDTAAYRPKKIKLSSLLISFILIASLYSTYKFSQQWLITGEQHPGIIEVIEAAQTADSQWVSMPYGEHFWGPPAAEAGLKLTNQFRPSFWKNREQPPAFIKAKREPPGAESSDYLGEVDSIHLTRYPQNTYAYIYINGQEIQPCEATGRGGNIDVHCQTGKPGDLIVRENYWSGWTVKRDGEWAPMSTTAPWLNTPAPAGEHDYAFRYRPWDVVAGFCVTLVGIFLAIWIWLRVSRPPHPETPLRAPTPPPATPPVQSPD